MRRRLPGSRGGEVEDAEDLPWAMPQGHQGLGGAGAGGTSPSADGDPCRPPSPARGRGVVPPQLSPVEGRTGGRGPGFAPLSQGGSGEWGGCSGLSCWGEYCQLWERGGRLGWRDGAGRESDVV